MDGESGVATCKCLHLERIKSKIHCISQGTTSSLLCGINYILLHYGINHNGKNIKKCTYIYN